MNMGIKTLSGANLKGKKILLRVDINSPAVDGIIQDSPRLAEAARSIDFLLKKKAKVAIVAHQGRKGDRDFIPLQQHAELISKHAGCVVQYIDSLFEEPAIEAIDSLENGQAILLKNVRGYDDETDIKKKVNRYKQLCSHFDLFVNDAFSVCHREQGSIILPPKYLPAFAGINMENELKALKNVNLKSASTAYVVGGAKVDDYLPIFSNLKNKKNKILASGVLANLLLVANGHDLGYESKWLESKGYFTLLPELKKLSKKYAKQIILPVDLALSVDGTRKEVDVASFPHEHKILDVGSKTVELFKEHLATSKAIFMKGPLGFSETPGFSYATVEVLKEVSSLTKRKKAFSLLGGGHLTTTADKHNIEKHFSHVSMSGGALIAYISGEKLPGIEALK